tara:strand:- start:1025 stop:1378 length:354 start_codon:yes stop_codon:yes gene_type:complete
MKIDYLILTHMSLINCTILILWLKTEALLEYAKLLGLSKLIKIDEYEKESNNNPFFTYHDFLLKKHNSFIMRLITCPICLTVWMSIFSAYFFGLWYLCPIIIVTLIVYFSLIKLMRE